MRIYKIILTGIMITIIAIGHVYQRVEIVKAGYVLQKSRTSLSQLVDQNSKLMYNLSKLESPRYLLASLNTEEIEFARGRHTSNYVIAYADTNKDASGESFVNKVLNIFKFRAKAELQD